MHRLLIDIGKKGNTDRGNYSGGRNHLSKCIAEGNVDGPSRLERGPILWRLKGSGYEVR